MSHDSRSRIETPGAAPILSAAPNSGATPDIDREAPVFVTGGTGFVGSHLVEALQARGYREIRCLVRDRAGWLETIDCVRVSGDLSSPETLREAITGCSSVYHVAGLTRARSWAEFERANIDGTVNLLTAASDMKAPPRVQVVSSLAAVGRADTAIANESTPLDPVSQYGRSKAMMESRVQVFRDRLPLVMVRPPAVYGPRDSDIFTIFKAASRGLFAVVGGSVDPALTLVHVSDLVRGMIKCLETSATAGRTYFLGADPPYTWAEVRDAAATAVGRRLLTLRIPRSFILPVGILSEAAGRLVGSYPPLNREKALEIRDACIMCTSGSARQDFDYDAATPLVDGFLSTASWYRDNGWL
jgi:nucleoside-diphosphate-sugar epimerase